MPHTIGAPRSQSSGTASAAEPAAPSAKHGHFSGAVAGSCRCDSDSGATFARRLPEIERRRELCWPYREDRRTAPAGRAAREESCVFHGEDETLSSLLTWVNAASFALGAIALAFAPYFALRWFFLKHVTADTQAFSTSVITRLGTLHALILAIVFAQEMENYLGVVKVLTQEAGAVADVYYGLKRYDPEDLVNLRRTVAEYVQTTVNDEWPMLAEDKELSPRAWDRYSQVEVDLLRLKPQHRYQEELLEEMLDDWDTVSDLRRAREVASQRRVPGFFWALAILGFMSVTIPYYAFSPKPANALVLALFAAYNGIVCYFVVALGNPFAGAPPFEPTALKTLFFEDMAGLIHVEPRS